MNDPHNLEVKDYIAPTLQELAARKKRNFAIAGVLFAFAMLVFFVILFKLGALNG